MNTLKITQVQTACKFGAIFVLVNNTDGKSVKETMEEIRKSYPLFTEPYLSEESEKEITRTNQFVRVELFIDNFSHPNIAIYHHSFVGAIEQAWELLNEKRLIA